MSSSISISDKIKPNPELGFGEKIAGQSLSSSTKDKIHSIAILTLLGVAILAAGALLGTVVAAPIGIALGSAAFIIGMGAASGAGLGFLGIVGIAIFSVKNRHRAAPETSHIQDPKAPKLGQFTKNHVLSTEHTKDSSEWKIDLIKNAEQSIELSGNFCGGKLFRETLEAIDQSLERSKNKDPAKMVPKLQVHLTASENLIEADDKKKLEELRKKWPKNFHYLETNVKLDFAPAIRSVENHVKLLVVDGKYFVVGGSGLQEEMGRFTGEDNEHISNEKRPAWKRVALAHAYRDMDFVGEGPAAKTWRVEFFKLWHIWSEKMGHKDPHAGHFALDETQPKGISPKWEAAKTAGDVAQDVEYMPLISDPEKPNAITDHHIKLIKSAKKTVRIANLAFNSANDVHDALHEAVQNGKDVSLVTNTDRKKDSPWCHNIFVRANYPNYLPLMMGRKITKVDTKASLHKEFTGKTNPVRIYEYAHPHVMKHTKALVVDEEHDDAAVISGSYNLGIKSHGLSDRGGDYETCQVIKSKKLAQRVARRLEKDIKLSQKLSFDDAHELYHHKGGQLQAKCLATFVV